MPKDSSQADIKTVIDRLDDLIHQLGQPLLGARFNMELLMQTPNFPSSGGAKTKIDHINQAISEASSVSSQISHQLSELKEILNIS